MISLICLHVKFSCGSFQTVTPGLRLQQCVVSLRLFCTLLSGAVETGQEIFCSLGF